MRLWLVVLGLVIATGAYAQSAVDGMTDAQKAQILELADEIRESAIQPFDRQPTAAELRARAQQEQGGAELQGAMFYQQTHHQAEAWKYGRLTAYARMQGQNQSGTVQALAKVSESACGGESSNGARLSFLARIGTRSKRCRESSQTIRYLLCVQALQMSMSQDIRSCEKVVDDSKWANFARTMGKGVITYLIAVNGMEVLDRTLQGAIGIGSAAVDGIRDIQGQQPQLIQTPAPQVFGPDGEGGLVPLEFDPER